jgi:hypothetical protein
MAQFLSSLKQKAEGLQRTAGPALAQAAQEYGPLVTQGIKQGVKEGLASLRDPKKSSKYYSINSISDLAMAPGNIQEEIQANLSAAAARSKSATPMLNSLLGKGTGNRIHSTLYSKQPSPLTQKPFVSPFVQNAATQKRFRNLATMKAQPFQFGQAMTSTLPKIPKEIDISEENMERIRQTLENHPELFEESTPLEMKGGRRRTRRQRKRRSTRKRIRR